MITVEKSPFHRPRLKEYKIEYGSTHFLQNSSVEICPLDSGPNEHSRLRIIKSGDEIIVILCNRNATIEIVKICPP